MSNEQSEMPSEAICTTCKEPIRKAAIGWYHGSYYPKPWREPTPAPSEERTCAKCPCLPGGHYRTEDGAIKCRVCPGDDHGPKESPAMKRLTTEERTCALADKNGRIVCGRPESEHCASDDCAGCDGIDHPFTPAPSEEPKPCPDADAEWHLSNINAGLSDCKLSHRLIPAEPQPDKWAGENGPPSTAEPKDAVKDERDKRIAELEAENDRLLGILQCRETERCQHSDEGDHR